MKTIFFIVFLLLPAIASADDPYYEISCGQQAEHVRSLAVLRDQSYSKQKIAEIIRDTYPTNYHYALIALLDTIFTLKSRNPQEQYLAVKSDCDNYGKESKKSPLFDTSGEKPRDYLRITGMQSCIAKKKQIDIARDELTSSERKLEAMNSDSKSSFERINSMGDAVSDERIEQHNATATKFKLENDKYLKLAQRYNVELENYNTLCGGKALK